MFCIEKPQISYDSKYDVLSYKIGDASNSYGDEDIDNIVVLKDMETEEITGYTIMNFKRICNNKTKEYDIISKIFNISDVIKKCES